jgi:hypothetical protein
MASQDRVERLNRYVQRVLKVLGFEDAMVTDESLVADFSDFGQGFSPGQLRRLRKRLGLPVSNDASIADLADALANETCQSWHGNRR